MPVGIFDSGLGGLSVLRAVRQVLPQHPVLYAADSGHAPYGERSTAYVRARTNVLARALLDQGAQALVIACNTASVLAAAELRAWSPVPVVAMEPAIKPACAVTRSGVVGVLATRPTLASDAVARLTETHAQGVRVLLQACPGWVELVERGDLNSPAARAAVAGPVQALLDAGADTLVLGCTHYPFLAPLIAAQAGPTVTLLDPAPAVARQLAVRLGITAAGHTAAHATAIHATRQTLADRATPAPVPPLRFFTSGDQALLHQVLPSLCPESGAEPSIEALRG